MTLPRVEVIDREDGFLALREEWDDLLQASAADGVFLTWEWLHTWWRCLSAGRTLSLLTVRSGEHLLAIAPFARRAPTLSPFRPLSTVELLGSDDVGSDYLDVIARRGTEEAVASALAERLAEDRLMLDLPRLPAIGAVACRVAERLEQAGWSSARRQPDVCPVITLTGRTFESYLLSLGSEHRYNFRRRRRSLSKAHKVRFAAVESDAERRHALGLLISLHNQRWEVRGGSTAFHSPELLRFHDEVTSALLKRGWLRLFVLWLDDTPAAVLYGVSYRGTFSFYQSGFDPAYSRQSVGLVTMGLAIERACEEQIGVYDFLHGHEAYKSLWTRERRDLIRLEVYPPHTRGLLYRATAEARRLAGRLARRVLDRAVPSSKTASISASGSGRRSRSDSFRA